MNKNYISLSIILLVAIGTLPTIFANGQTHLTPGNILVEDDGKNQCYTIKLLQSVTQTLQPGESATYLSPTGSRENCMYVLDINGRDLCESCGNESPGAQYYVIVKFKDDKSLRLPSENGYYESCQESISILQGIPGTNWKDVEYIQVINDREISLCSITYTWKLYSLCPCEKGKQALYPKVDIEQFTVTGGATIIKDGKILTNFNVIPGVQQTFIQIENRGFFTQKDVKVKVVGLPQGVNVTITPGSQMIKSHNLGTYQATFEVGPNVPSGTYKISMIAYSDNGVFDAIQFDLIIP